MYILLVFLDSCRLLTLLGCYVKDELEVTQSALCSLATCAVKLHTAA